MATIEILDGDAQALREVLSLALEQSEAQLRDSDEGPADLAYWTADDHNRVTELLVRIDAMLPPADWEESR